MDIPHYKTEGSGVESDQQEITQQQTGHKAANSMFLSQTRRLGYHIRTANWDEGGDYRTLNTLLKGGAQIRIELHRHHFKAR